jgi:hypothetical protein
MLAALRWALKWADGAGGGLKAERPAALQRSG